MDGFAIRLRRVGLRLPVGSRAWRRGRSPALGAPMAAARGRATEVAALEDVSLTVARGTRMGLIGHNGAGKTVLLRVMAGIYPPTSGSREARGRLSAMLETGVGDYRESTGFEYAVLMGLSQGMTRAEVAARIPDIAGFSGLGDWMRQPLRAYSAGMRVRLAFAIATCARADTLLLDEDIGAADPGFRARARARVDSMLGPEGALVMASQSMRAVREFCDSAVWLHEGRVRAIGPAGETVEAYLRERGGSALDAEAGAAANLPSISASS